MMYSLLKETKNCQVCKKSFTSGRAFGVHMKSHSRNLSAPGSDSVTGLNVPSLKTSRANFRPHEKVLMRSVHTNEVDVASKPDLKREEGGQQLTCEGKIVVDLDEPRSCLTDVEEGALILMAMSKGQRPQNCQNWNAIDRLLSTPNEKNEYDGDDEHLISNVENEDEDVDDETYLVAKEKQCKKKFICDICGKGLHSYQALGGHRTSHRSKRLKICDKNDKAIARHYDCEFCGRVFESGQALGGHKKVHYMFM